MIWIDLQKVQLDVEFLHIYKFLKMFDNKMYLLSSCQMSCRCLAIIDRYLST